MLSAAAKNGEKSGFLVQSWDTAVKMGAGNDASACATFAEREGRHYLLDVLVVRLEYPELKRCVMNHAARFSADAVLVEDAASGQSLIQDLRRECALPLIARVPLGSKTERLVRVTPMMEAGLVHLPKHAGWLHAFEEELFHFPEAPHDDQVDAFSQYLNWIRERQGHGRPTIRRL